MPAREAVQSAACLAGIAIDNAGTALAHNLGHALASLRPVHHGRAVGAAMLATLPWNMAVDPAGRWAAVAAAFGADQPLPLAFGRVLREVGVSVDLAAEGFGDVSADMLAAQAARPENMPMRRSNVREIGDADLRELAQAVLSLA